MPLPSRPLLTAHSDRELPGCHVCEETGQACAYPTRSLKPGPKIGKYIQNDTHVVSETLR